MRRTERVQLLLEYVDDIGTHDNHTEVILKDEASTREYVWRTRVTPNMQKVPLFFSECSCVKGGKVLCKANIVGIDCMGRTDRKSVV